MNIFIIGLTGGIGARLAQVLLEEEDRVSGLCRRPEHCSDLGTIGVQGYLGDITVLTPTQLASMMGRSDAVVFTAGAGAADSESMTDAIDGDGVRTAMAAARLAGVNRFILVSVFPEAWRERNMPRGYEHYMEVKKAADVDLAKSDLDWIILRPSTLNDGPATGRISIGFAEIHTEIAREDVAATIAALLHSKGIHRRILELTGGPTEILHAVRALQDRADGV